MPFREKPLECGNNQLYVPAGCGGYTIWPLGYEVVPTYLSTVTQSVSGGAFNGF